jgi:hypothetical protein
MKKREVDHVLRAGGVQGLCLETGVPLEDHGTGIDEDTISPSA